MTEIINDLKYGLVKTLITKKILNNESKDLFINTMLNDNNNSIWYDEPLKNYEKLYVAYIPKKKSFLKEYYNETYNESVNSGIIVSYILIKRSEYGYFIELTETHDNFKGLGINTALINWFIKFYKLKEKNKKIVPLYPIPASTEYWIKFFETHYKIFNKFQLRKFRNNFPVLRLKWEYLYEYYDKIYNQFVNIRIVKMELDEVNRMIKMINSLK